MTFRAKQLVDYWLGGLALLLLWIPMYLVGLVMRRDHSLTRRKGCAIVKMVGAGSVFLAMPSLQAVRREFPDGAFCLVCTREVANFARGFGWFDHYCVIDDSGVLRLTVSTARAIWYVARHCDHVIDLEVHSRLTTVISVLTTVRNRIGFVDEIAFWRRAFYTHMTFFNPHGPVYAFYDMLSGWFDIPNVPVAEFHASFRDRALKEALPPDLPPPGTYVTVAAACSSFGKERQLRPEEWRGVLHSEAPRDAEWVFLGGPGDAALADEVIATVGRGRNLCGRLTLTQAARVLAECRTFYGIDSLLLHLARASGVPTVSLWGPTHPATRLRPLNAEERVVYVNPPCSPCIHIHETPPCQGARPCMAAAVRSLIAGGAADSERSALSAIGWLRYPGDTLARQASVRAV